MDIIHGGAKSNALPEYVEAPIKHRVAIERTTHETLDKDLIHVGAVAEKIELGLVVEGQVLRKPTPHGYLNVTTNEALDPAPLTPPMMSIGNSLVDLLDFTKRLLQQVLGALLVDL